MISKETLEKLEDLLKEFPANWDGRQSVLEMRDAGYKHWKQMEWIGFYFQFLCDTRLAAAVTIPGPKYGRVEFDGLLEVPWDFKAHPSRDTKGKDNNKVIVNDSLAVAAALKQFGTAGLILAIGEATYNDKDRSFQIWHKDLKGGLSSYEKTRILRDAPSRLRKTAFKMNEIRLIEIDDKQFKAMGSFQKGFRNSDGSPRNEKILLDINQVVPLRVITFN